MNGNNIKSNVTDNRTMKDVLLEFATAFTRRRRFIFSLWIIAILSAAIISLLLPKVYESKAVIIPPQDTSGMSNLLSSVSGNAMLNLAGTLFGMPSSADLYVGILKSRTIAETIIKRFNLQSVYKERYFEDTLDDLAQHTDIKKSKEETISITIQDKDPNRAADIANAYVTELDKIARQLGMGSASTMRVFLEQRVNETKKELQTAEDNLKNFQITHKMVALDEQTKAVVEGAAELEGQLIAAETELGILRSFSTENNARVKLVQAKITELKKQLNQMEGNAPSRVGTKLSANRNVPTEESAKKGFYIPLLQMPDLGMALVRLLREVKIQETVFELLTQQYELAKVNEVKDTQTIQILDAAKVPDKKTKPKRTVIVLTTAILSFLIAVLLAFWRNRFDQLDLEERKQWVNVVRIFLPSFLFRKISG